MAYVFVIITLFVSFSYAAPIKPTTLAFWNATNQLTDIANQWVFNYRRRKIAPTDPLYKELEKPENVAKIKQAILAKWAARVESEFTEKEIIYLTQLFSHSIMKKSSNFDVSFWGESLTPIVSETIKVAPPSKK